MNGPSSRHPWLEVCTISNPKSDCRRVRPIDSAVLVNGQVAVALARFRNAGSRRGVLCPHLGLCAHVRRVNGSRYSIPPTRRAILSLSVFWFLS